MADKQHRERIEELRKDIETGVKELRDSGTWQRYLDFMGRFHQYSWNNILLMLMQSNGNSSLVAGFRQWQTRGRVVRKGEHGMKIFGFSARTVKDEDGNPQLDENGDPIQKVWYPILTVFDVSQTDPIDKETDPIEQMKPSELEGADVLGLVGRMTAWLESKHWRVGHESMGEGRQRLHHDGWKQTNHTQREEQSEAGRQDHPARNGPHAPPSGVAGR